MTLQPDTTQQEMSELTAATKMVETETILTNPKWPSEPEGLLSFVPVDLEGSPLEMLTGTLMKANGIVVLLCAEFMGDGEYRPNDQEIASALWAVQSQLHLARELLERLD